jgi:isoamylase
MTASACVVPSHPIAEPPLGSMIVSEGVHFRVYSSGERVDLMLFDRRDDERPTQVIELEREPHASACYWHGLVAGARAGQLYGYRVHGPLAPERGLRFDPEKLLLDPYARCVATPSGRRRTIDSRSGNNQATAFRSVVVDTDAYDWGADRPPRVPYEKTVIYELHVGNFTRHPSSGMTAPLRGTFAGIVGKIPYLCDLGITAVELMPVFAFDEQAAAPGLKNIWGYEPISFFAPHEGYASNSSMGAALNEFRDMTQALHRAGIEVILDVVYNHSAEDDASGPTLSFRGLANDAYYSLLPGGAYANYSGCGNTLNVGSPIVTQLILDSLRYWVSEMHVDGFRFDLAAVLLRDGNGRAEGTSPILTAIDSDPTLKDVKLIAEAWDAAGLAAVGRFTSLGWREWNGRFRDDARQFIKSDNGAVRRMACRLAGSADLYPVQRCMPSRSINFVACHDGFTLNDLVSYNGKHNEANREDNRDGSNDNYSWNCGIEGPSDDTNVNELRTRQIKNFLALTLLAAGTPMLLMGDEVRRSQGGNNNGYCLDGEPAWLDWQAIQDHADVHRFARELIALRNGLQPSMRPLLKSASGPLIPRNLEWHGVRLREPDWSEQSHSLAVRIEYARSELSLYLVLNAYWEALAFEVPRMGTGAHWRRCVDTSRPFPHDICFDVHAEEIVSPSLVVQPRSVVVLLVAKGPLSLAGAGV